MLWLALHLPHLPLQALPWSRPGFAATLPVAVVEQHRLLAINRAARALGVQTGQSAATALALAPQLQALPREPAREAAFVETLALALAALTPNLCPLDGGVLLEVQASLRLFGGVRRLQRRAEALARECGAQVRVAWAPSASGAWLLASSGLARRRALRAAGCARRLDAVPVEALRALLPLAPSQLELMEALGVHRLGELRALPRAGLQRRLGRAFATALDRAYGEAPDPRRWFAPPERFELRRELMQRADDAAVLCAAVEALLPALHGWLQLHWRAASVLALRLVHERRREPLPDTVLRLQLSTPSRDTGQIALLWRERLQRHALAAPVYELALALEASVPHGGTPGELLPRPGHDAAGHAALLDRLVARLGAERVQRFEPLPDHRPERAQRAVPAIGAEAPEAGSEAAAGPKAPAAAPPSPASRAPSGDVVSSRSAGPAKSAVPAVPAVPAASRPAASSVPPEAFAAAVSLTAPLRPTWLLDPPEPLASDAYGRPLHGGPLQLCSRAERIEAGWFDDGLARRDYHVALGGDHRLRWIYRERRAGAAAHEAGWFLHGWFG
jgi:protein ImuB